MDLKTINQIVSWIWSQEEGYDEKIYCRSDTPAETWFKFLAEPDSIGEYPEIFRPRVDDGCAYLYRKGQLIGSQCGQALVPEKNRCPHHDHPIFSDKVQSYIDQQHDQINKTHINQNYVEKKIIANGLLKVTSIGQSLLRESEKGLVILDSPRLCIGYIPLRPDERPIRQLTPELRQYCHSIRLDCIAH